MVADLNLNHWRQSFSSFLWINLHFFSYVNFIYVTICWTKIKIPA